MSDPPGWDGPGDGECTYAPDTVLGVSLTKACRVHDKSALDDAAHRALGEGIRASFIADWSARGRILRGLAPIIGAIVGGIYAAGTRFWQIIKPIRRRFPRR